MPRSLKKGPFVDDHLLEEGRRPELQRTRSGSSRPGRVARRSSPTWSATPSPSTTAASTCRSTSPSRWSATSSASSRRRGPSGTTPARNGREALMPALKTNERAGHPRRAAALPHVGLQGPRRSSTSSGARTCTGPRRSWPAPTARPPRSVGKVLASAVANAVTQRRAGPRGALRLGLLRRRGHHHQALAAPGPGPGHPDPQADLPHHGHREPAARRAARTLRRAPERAGRRAPARSRRVDVLAPPRRPVRRGCRRASRAAQARRPRGRGDADGRRRADERTTESTRSRPTRPSRDEAASDETATTDEHRRRGARPKRPTDEASKRAADETAEDRPTTDTDDEEEDE